MTAHAPTTLAGDAAACIIGGCDDPREPGRVMCAVHWATVPVLLQQLLIEASRERGRVGGLKRYLELVRAARVSVERPGQQIHLPLRPC